MRNDFLLLVLGTRGSGKTAVTFGGDPAVPSGLVEQTKGRRFIYDPRGSVPGKSDWLSYQSAAHIKDWLTAEANGHRKAYTPAAYYFRPRTRDSKRAFWELLGPVETNGTLTKGMPGTFFVDEAHQLAPATAKVMPEFLDSVEMGGPHGMSFVLVTRRYKQIDRSVRTQASAILSFRQPEEEIAQIEKEFDRRAKAIRGLEGHEFTLFGERTAELPFAEWLESQPTYVTP